MSNSTVSISVPLKVFIQWSVNVVTSKFTFEKVYAKSSVVSNPLDNNVYVSVRGVISTMGDRKCILFVKSNQMTTNEQWFGGLSGDLFLNLRTKTGSLVTDPSQIGVGLGETYRITGQIPLTHDNYPVAIWIDKLVKE